MFMVVTLSYDQSYLVDAAELAKLVSVLERAVPVKQEYLNGETYTIKCDKRRLPRVEFVEKVIEQSVYDDLVRKDQIREQS